MWELKQMKTNTIGWKLTKTYTKMNFKTKVMFIFIFGVLSRNNQREITSNKKLDRHNMLISPFPVVECAAEPTF